MCNVAHYTCTDNPFSNVGRTPLLKCVSYIRRFNVLQTAIINKNTLNVNSSVAIHAIHVAGLLFCFDLHSKRVDYIVINSDILFKYNIM